MNETARHYGLSGTARGSANDNDARRADPVRLWTWRLLIAWAAFWIIFGSMEVLHVIAALVGGAP